MEDEVAPEADDKHLKDMIVPEYDNESENVIRNTDFKRSSRIFTSLEFARKVFRNWIIRSSIDVFIECTKKAKQLRLFSLVPLKRGFECSHLKICNNGLHGLLKRGGLQVPPSDSRWREEADSWWRKLFRIDRFGTSNRKFAGEILADGKAVSVVMRKPKKTVASRRIDLSDCSQVWGLDPGRKDMFVASNESGPKVPCSTREFYEDARYTESLKKIKRWQDSHPDILEAIRNMPTKKTASVKKLKQHVDFLLPRLDLLLDFHIRKDLHGLIFKQHVFAQKKLQLLCRKLTDGTRGRTLVGFGDWSNRDQVGFIKKSPAGPVEHFESQLERYCSAIAVDEYRTSKLHSECHGELKDQYPKKPCRDREVRVMKVPSVLHCTHNGCRDVTVNRDANASRNILLKCEISGVSLPVAFRRSRQCADVPTGGIYIARLLEHYLRHPTCMAPCFGKRSTLVSTSAASLLTKKSEMDATEQDASAAPRALTAAEKRAARRARVLQGGENRLKLVTGQISTLKEGSSAESAFNKEMDDALNELLGATDDSNTKSTSASVREEQSKTGAGGGATGGAAADPRFALRPDPAQRRRDAALRRQKKEAVVQELLAPLTATTQSRAEVTNTTVLSPAVAAKETTNVVPKSTTAKAPATFSRHAFALRLHSLEEKAITLVIFAAAVYLGFNYAFWLAAAMTIDLQSISTDLDAKDQILLSYQELLAQGLPLDSIRQQMEREHLEGPVVERIERLLSAQFSEAQPNVSFTNKFLPNVWDLPEYFSSLVCRPPVIVCVLLVRLLLTLVANGVHLAFQLPDVKNPQEDDLGFIVNLALSSKPALKDSHRSFVVTGIGYLIKFRKSFDDVFFFLYVLLLAVALRAIWAASFA
ncbi:hypothetical protein FI667_g14517, partial [Globisporangium splendens]